MPKETTKKTARIDVYREPGSDTQVSMTFGFDPEERGPERCEAIYKAIAIIALNVLDPEEYPELMKKFAAARDAARVAHTPSARKRRAPIEKSANIKRQ